MRLFIIIVTILLSSFQQVLGQDSMAEAELEFERGYWEEAISIYSKLIESPKDDEEYVNFSQKLGLANYHLKNYTIASSYFDKIKHTIPNQSEDVKFIYFNCLRSIGKYREAEAFEKTYLSNAYNKINYINYPLTYTRNSKDSFFVVKPLSLDFGTAFLGMSFVDSNTATLPYPITNKDEETSFYDIQLFSVENDTSFSLIKKSKVIKNKRTVFYRGTPTSFNGGILFSGNISEHSVFKEKKREKYNISESAVNLLNLFEYKFEDKNEFISTLNEPNSNSTTPYFDSIHKVLFFSSDRKESLGGYDIFYSFLKNNKWSLPKLLPMVNTHYDEVYPFYQRGILTFSSKGGQNFGGLDVFTSVCNIDTEKETVTINEIRNLGQPINSSFDDFSLIWKSKFSGYLASNRISKNKEDALLFFKYNPIDTLDFNVFNEGHKRLNAVIYVSEKNINGEWIVVDSISVNDSVKNYISVDLKKEYQFKVESNSYESKLLSFKEANDYNELQETKMKFKEVVLIAKPTVFTLKDEDGNPIPYAEVTIYGKRKKIGDFRTDKKGFWTYSDSTIFDVDGKYIVNYMNDKGVEQRILLTGVDILGERQALKDNNGRVVKNKNITVIKEKELLANLKTDQNGQFEYDFEEEIDYEIEIKATGYELEEIDFTYEMDSDLERGNYEYAVKLKQDYPVVKNNRTFLKIRDEFNHDFQNIEVKIFDENFDRINTSFTNEFGEVDYEFDYNSEYNIEISTRGYETEKLNFIFSDELAYNLKLKRKLGTINNTNEFDVVYFGFNNYRLRNKTKETLRNVARNLDNNPTQKFILYGHTDAVGPNSYNKRLAKKRASYCLDYLLSLGNYSSRITVVSVGEEEVKNGCTTWDGCSKDENQVNRRVEILMNK